MFNGEVLFYKNTESETRNRESIANSQLAKWVNGEALGMRKPQTTPLLVDSLCLSFYNTVGYDEKGAAIFVPARISPVYNGYHGNFIADVFLLAPPLSRFKQFSMQILKREDLCLISQEYFEDTPETPFPPLSLMH